MRFPGYKGLVFSIFLLGLQSSLLAATEKARCSGLQGWSGSSSIMHSHGADGFNVTYIGYAIFGSCIDSEDNKIEISCASDTQDVYVVLSLRPRKTKANDIKISIAVDEHRFELNGSRFRGSKSRPPQIYAKFARSSRFFHHLATGRAARFKVGKKSLQVPLRGFNEAFAKMMKSCSP